MTPPFHPENAFSLPTPLVPKLVALGLDTKTAATLSNVYTTAALNLKEVCETEYTRACDAIMATGEYRGHSSKEISSKLLTVAVARYTQALSNWAEEAAERVKACLLHRSEKVIPEPKVKATAISSEPRLRSPVGSAKIVAAALPLPTEPTPCRTRTQDSTPFNATSPSHAFPQLYPPPARPELVTFVTHSSRNEKGFRYQPKAVSDSDLDACITALSQLSLGPPSPQSRSFRKSSRAGSKLQSRNHATSTPRLTPRLSPSRPRLVSPAVDTSVAVSHKTPPKNTPSHLPTTNMPRTKNIDIPLSNRRKVCSIPYRRPAIHQSASPESPSSFSQSIRRTPSLVSDHGSEASSPSTPPDFPSMLMPVPPSTLARKDSFPESVSPLELLFVSHSESGWQDIDFGTDVYG